jgi:hypothetical protein
MSISEYAKLKRKFGVVKSNHLLNALTKTPLVDVSLNTPTIDVPTDGTVQIDSVYMPIDDGYEKIITCVDLHSRHVGAVAVKSGTAKDACDALKILLKSEYFKDTVRIEVDNGSEFKKEFKKLVNDLKIHYVLKKPYRHRSQAMIEGFVNKNISKLLNNRMLADELSTGEISINWKNDLDDAVKLMNMTIDKNKKKPAFSFRAKERAKKSQNGKLPICSGDACRILPIDTVVRTQLDEPRSAVTNKIMHGKFKAGDLRWETKTSKIKQISLRPNQPPMYLLDEAGPIVAYTKNQLQVVKPSEKGIYKEAIKKYTVEKILGKKVINKKVHYLIKWKHFPDSDNTFEPIVNIPAQMIKDYNKK